MYFWVQGNGITDGMKLMNARLSNKVPEPASLALVGLALLGAGLAGRRSTARRRTRGASPDASGRASRLGTSRAAAPPRRARFGRARIVLGVAAAARPRARVEARGGGNATRRPACRGARPRPAPAAWP
jgi:hypothetical protein